MLAFNTQPPNTTLELTWKLSLPRPAGLRWSAGRAAAGTPSGDGAAQQIIPVLGSEKLAG